MRKLLAITIAALAGLFVTLATANAFAGIGLFFVITALVLIL